MRDVKFRAWDSEKKQMARVSMLGEEEAHLYNVTGETWVSPKHYVAVIMQYTGLKDKNDVEIYEGHVLRDSESIVIVKFSDGKFSVDYRTMGGKWRNYGSLFDYLKDYEGEVIGNVYQNPELLEREAE